MGWLTEHKLGTRRLESWTRARPHIETLARFLGYVPDGFRWRDCEAVQFEFKLKVANDAAKMALDTEGPTVRPHKHTYAAVNFQTLARAGQICQLNRRHLTIDPDAELPRLPSFGPVKLLQLGERASQGRRQGRRHGSLGHAHPAPISDVPMVWLGSEYGIASKGPRA